MAENLRRAFLLQLAIALAWKASLSAALLPAFDNVKEWSPDLAGAYHTDFFHVLGEKYSNDERKPSSTMDLLSDMHSIMATYCPDDKKCADNFLSVSALKSSVQGTSSGGKINIEKVPKVLKKYAVRIESVVQNADDKDSALKELLSIKEEVELSELNSVDKEYILIVLSVAFESLNLWHDVKTDEDHPFNVVAAKLSNGRGLRKLQSPWWYTVIMADINGALDDDSGDILSMIISAIVASALAFWDEFFGDAPVNVSAQVPDTNSPSLPAKPSLMPSTSQMPTTIGHTNKPFPTPSTTPTKIPLPPTPATNQPTTSTVPTIKEETLNRLITCVAVIDESCYGQTVGCSSHHTDFRSEWDRFRSNYPDRPFCLLQVLPFTSESLNIPPKFTAEQSEGTVTYSTVARDQGNVNDRSDWFEKCDLAGLRQEGITRLAFFIDESGSMTRRDVEASFNYFEERVFEEGLEIVAGIYNEDENWIAPFNTDFGYDTDYLITSDFFSFLQYLFWLCFI